MILKRSLDIIIAVTRWRCCYFQTLFLPFPKLFIGHCTD
eukprot:07261.XXX_137182_137298_1 [CDS] Oithona nana genome sequencing.